MKYLRAALLSVAVAASAAAQETPPATTPAPADAALAAQQAYAAARPSSCAAAPPAPSLTQGAGATQAQINASTSAFNAWAGQIQTTLACLRADAEDQSYFARVRVADRNRELVAYRQTCLAWLPELNEFRDRNEVEVPAEQREVETFCRPPPEAAAPGEPTESQRALVAANPTACQGLAPAPELADGARANRRQFAAAQERYAAWEEDARVRLECWRTEAANQSFLTDQRIGEHNAVLATFRRTCESWITELNEFRDAHEQAIPPEHGDVVAFCRGGRAPQ